MQMRLLDTSSLENVIANLRQAGFRVMGPVSRNGAIRYEPITSMRDLPRGVVDRQGPGSYRLEQTEGGAYFGFATPEQSLKPLFFARSEPLVTLRRSRDTIAVEEHDGSAESPVAVIGVHACDIAGLAVQDRIFATTDVRYANRRKDAFIIAVNCSRAVETCFCTSMGTGPRASAGFDLCLTELTDGEHRFVVEIGSERGRRVLEAVTTTPASEADSAAVVRVTSATAASIERSLNTNDIRDVLYANLEHPRWDQVASRCLSCANCTLACPTCFCFSVHEQTNVTDDEVHRTRQWDSCFNDELAEVHGHPVRDSIRARYRQWLTHKLAGWLDQFGTSGCVGCGRCIAWCPAGIDLTEEVAAIREAPTLSDRFESDEP